MTRFDVEAPRSLVAELLRSLQAQGIDRPGLRSGQLPAEWPLLPGDALGLPTSTLRQSPSFAGVLRSELGEPTLTGKVTQAAMQEALARAFSSSQITGRSSRESQPRGPAHQIKPVNQTDLAEYDSPAQARAWGGSTCSAAALTAVLRSRGGSARIADVMAAMPGGITVDQGLVSRPALVSAASRFGLRVHDDVQTYDALQKAAGNGEPVLVDVRNQRFPDGHWLVVTAVGPQGVQVADSSGYHLTSMSREAFTDAWSGRGIRVEASMTTAQPQFAGGY